MSVRDLAFAAVLLALAMVFGYVEAQIPFNFVTPGIKLGLCNLVIVCTLYLLGAKYALVISVARIFLVGIMFGNPMNIPYSLAGGLLSLAVMTLLYRYSKLSVVAISCFGGICHNIGQIFVAVAVVENLNLFRFLPILLVAGFVTGLVIGIVCRLILPAVSKSFDVTVRR